jgi:hypothetical protein
MTLKCSFFHGVKGSRLLGIILRSHFEISEFMQNLNQTSVFYGYERILTNRIFPSGSGMTKPPNNYLAREACLLDKLIDIQVVKVSDSY